MLTKRTLVLLSLSLPVLLGAAIALLGRDSDTLRRMEARHVRHTTFVSAGNLRLAGFFDGVMPDPRFDARKALLRAGAVRGCAASRRGRLLDRLTALIERTAYAQGGCSSGCDGCFSDVTSGDCQGPACSGSYVYPVNGSICNQGTYWNSPACSGTCTTDCNSADCTDNSECNCGGGGGSCQGVGANCDSVAGPYCCANEYCSAGICWPGGSEGPRR